MLKVVRTYITSNQDPGVRICKRRITLTIPGDSAHEASEADLLLCAVTGRVFEPVGLMKRDLDVQAQIVVEPMSGPTSGVRVYFVFTHCRCLVFAFVSGLHFPRIPLTHPQPALHPQPHSPMHPPLLWQTPHHPYQALHSLTPQSRLFTQLTSASSSLPPFCMELCTANSPPRFARATGHHQARFWSSRPTEEPK